jgi:toxin ParE1/3/4
LARLILSPRFVAELKAEIAYIHAENAAGAARIEAQVRQSLARLVDFPLSGRPGRVAGTRELVVPKTPYIVAYRVNEDHIAIAAIRHGRRRWPKWF